jgi:outer membrane protein TolC
MALLLKRIAVGVLPLVVSGCVSADGGFESKFGFSRVSAETGSVLRKETVWVQNARESEGIRTRVRSMVQRKTLSADTAVQVALLNNRGLQAAYADIGASTAEAWQESLFVNPSVSIGASQVTAARTIEGVVAANIVAFITRERRLEVASIRLAETQMKAVERTLSVAAETRAAWIEAVSAWEQVSYLNRAKAAADAAAELASKLGGTGAMTKADQAREQVLYAELTGRAAEARLAARLAKERLIRAMGVYGQDIDFQVPNALPGLPKRVGTRTAIEAEALRNRVDLKIGKLELEALAKSYGLSKATRLVSDLELGAGLEVEREIEESEDGKEEKKDVVSGVFEASFEIPIFDSGEARLRKAEFEYMRSANLLAEKAVNARSEARSAYQAYRSSYDIARHYRSSVLPLRTTIEQEGLLTYNGMITNTFDLLTDTRERVNSTIQSLNSKRAFWLAEAGLTTAIYGGAASDSPEAEAEVAEAGGDED